MESDSDDNSIGAMTTAPQTRFRSRLSNIINATKTSVSYSLGVPAFNGYCIKHLDNESRYFVNLEAAVPVMNLNYMAGATEHACLEDVRTMYGIKSSECHKTVIVNALKAQVAGVEYVQRGSVSMLRQTAISAALTFGRLFSPFHANLTCLVFPNRMCDPSLGPDQPFRRSDNYFRVVAREAATFVEDPPNFTVFATHRANNVDTRLTYSIRVITPHGTTAAQRIRKELDHYVECLVPRQVFGASVQNVKSLKKRSCAYMDHADATRVKWEYVRTAKVADISEVPLNIPLFDLTVQVCSEHVWEIVRRLAAMLGPGNWTDTPHTIQVIDAWNSVLKYAGASVEVHVPDELELQIYEAQANVSREERCEQHVAGMVIQRYRDLGHHGIGVPEQHERVDARLDRSVQHINHLLNQTSVETLKRMEDECMKPIEKLADMIETDAETARAAVTDYAPHGVSFTVTVGEGDAMVAECKDVRRIMGRVAVYLFMKMHAHHVRAIDLRYNGALKYGVNSKAHSAMSEILLQAVGMCTQVRVLRSAREEFVNACAANLGTSVQLIEIDVLNRIHVRGRDVGVMFAPFAACTIPVEDRLPFSQINYSWERRFVTRMHELNQGFRPNAVVSDHACIDVATDMCTPSISSVKVNYYLTMTDVQYDFMDSMIGHCNRNDLSKLEVCAISDFNVGLVFVDRGPFPNLKSLRLICVPVRHETMYGALFKVLKTVAPNLEAIAIKSTVHMPPPNPVQMFRTMMDALPKTVKRLEVDQVPQGVQVELAREAAARNMIVYHSPSIGIKSALEEVPEAEFRTEPVRQVTLDKTTCSDVYAPVNVAYIPKGQHTEFRLRSLVVTLSDGEMWQWNFGRLNGIVRMLTDETISKHLAETLRELTVSLLGSKLIEYGDKIQCKVDMEEHYAVSNVRGNMCCKLVSALADALTTSPVSSKLNELKILYVVNDPDEASKIGAWVGRHANLASLAFWTTWGKPLDSLCEAMCPDIEKRNSVLVEFSSTGTTCFPQKYTTAEAAATAEAATGSVTCYDRVVSAVLRNRIELRRAAATVVSMEKQRRKATAAATRNAAAASSFFVTTDFFLPPRATLAVIAYKDHPWILNEMNRHCGWVHQDSELAQWLRTNLGHELAFSFRSFLDCAAKVRQREEIVSRKFRPNNDVAATAAASSCGAPAAPAEPPRRRANTRKRRRKTTAAAAAEEVEEDRRKPDAVAVAAKKQEGGDIPTALQVPFIWTKILTATDFGQTLISLLPHEQLPPHNVASQENMAMVAHYSEKFRSGGYKWPRCERLTMWSIYDGEGSYLYGPRLCKYHTPQREMTEALCYALKMDKDMSVVVSQCMASDINFKKPPSIERCDVIENAFKIVSTAAGTSSSFNPNESLVVSTVAILDSLDVFVNLVMQKCTYSRVPHAEPQHFASRMQYERSWTAASASTASAGGGGSRKRKAREEKKDEDRCRRCYNMEDEENFYNRKVCVCAMCTNPVRPFLVGSSAERHDPCRCIICLYAVGTSHV